MLNNVKDIAESLIAIPGAVRIHQRQGRGKATDYVGKIQIDRMKFHGLACKSYEADLSARQFSDLFQPSGVLLVQNVMDDAKIYFLTLNAQPASGNVEPEFLMQSLHDVLKRALLACPGPKEDHEAPPLDPGLAFASSSAVHKNNSKVG